MNPNTGGQLGGGESNGAGLAFNWTPTENVSVYWNNTYSRDEFAPQAVALISANTLRSVLADGTLIADGNPTRSMIRGPVAAQRRRLAAMTIVCGP